MSVINKMLRDLDQRQDGGMPTSASEALSEDQAALREGTASVAFGESAERRPSMARSRVGITVGLLASVVLATGTWFWLQANRPVAGTQATQTAPAIATPLSAASAPATAPVASPTTAAATAIAATPTDTSPPVAQSEAVNTSPVAVAVENAPNATMALRMETSLSARRALDALLSTATPSVTQAPNTASTTVAAAPLPPPVPPAASGATGSNGPRVRPVAAPQPATATPATTSDSAPVIQRQQQAGGDAMTQAQALWNSGSHDAAIELMQQSIAAAERSAKAAPSAGSAVVLVALVREMTRMQLAEGRFGAVWEMLTRLETLLGNQPDLWAIRANAAQRLGRHQDSVHAYMMALQSRPDEQRWLLGTAVSLAALGQTSSAAEMAEKGRAVGPVSKEVLAYLRQAGVPLREP